ncbi:ATP-binding protein [Halapricum hydrolyticum]|uniref:ATP-binding protein n=1 Tax=Halapricum hydrolyticum TaxID=2979991 RepID=A0AAE3IDK6_9EURY|nr:ATP-binding protein [Halapricum hydrolyticum]MCU4719585.1 ATP-binding protein [Halapricum hydrolyticum]MCU4728590.1 ATP-binding protein [Halapricum hydrolyticum]
MREYLRVTPTSEGLDPEGIPRVLESLHKLTTAKSTGLAQKLNPLHSKTPPKFEFLALSEGADDPVEFFYGADEHLDTLEKRLRSIYPETFDIERVNVDIASQLIQPVEFTPAEFIEYYEAGQLQYEFSPDEQHELGSDVRDQDQALTTEAPSVADGGTTVGLSLDHFVKIGETALELAPQRAIPDQQPLTTLEKPTETAEGTILARPTVDAVSPVGVRWSGSTTRKKDWMTSLTPFASEDEDDGLAAIDQPGATLASLVDHLMEAASPVAFQVVFQRRTSWQSDVEIRKEDLVDGRDTFFQEIVGSFLEVEDQRSNHDEKQLSESVAKRIEYIDAKSPKRSFTANIRAVGVPTGDEARDDLAAQMKALRPVFDPIDGPYYEVEGERLRTGGFREKTKEKNAQRALQQLLDRKITTGRGKTRPDFVLCGTELANFVLVPSSEQLTVEGTRGTRAEQQSRNPLPWPNPDLVQQFQEGMEIGYALDENGSPQPDPIRIPPNLLTTHYGRFASTGGGKSKAIINDALSLRATTGGPVVIVDPKGDGMCANYLRCHYERFNGVDDVYQFRVPETVPAFSFFDIRPALKAGRNREDAIQDKVDHFHDIMRMVMGRKQYGQAFVANEILSYLIKALFDEEYGSDAFGLDDLFAAALQMQRERTVPPVAAENQNVEESLTRHFEKDDRRFQVSMDAVGNRLDKLREDAHLRHIFSHVPEQGDDGEYVDNRFDFREFLDEDATILFDLGDLRPEAQRAITLLLLSNLWDAVQVRRRDGKTDYEKLTNLIIEEAAPVASTKLVSEQLLPQGRSFGLSMGLVMQFPEQVRNRSERAYNEVLNNIKTKLIGNISIERDLAESLAHEDLSPTDLRNRINTLPSGEWIAQLPSPSFGETGPAPFSVKPLPIAVGHPESDEPLSIEQEDHFETVALPRLSERTQTQYGLAEATSESEPGDTEGWGSRSMDERSTYTESDSPVDTTQSSFIGQATSGSAADEENEGNERNEGEDRDTINPLFGDPESTESEELVGEEEETVVDENRSLPVQAGGVTVPDDELRRRGLTHDDVRFLTRILDVMNGDAPNHGLLDSMSAFKNDFDDLDVQRLVDQDLLEEGRACGRKYYTVLPAGRELLGQKLKVGPGQGDVGEKTPHKVGVKLLKLWLDSRDDVAQVESYYEYDEETVFDVAGFDADGELVWVGEAELASNNKHAPVDDYDKQSAVDANAVWAFNRRETAVEVLDCLSEANRIESSVSGRAARSFSDIREAVESFDATGLTTIRSFNKLDQEFNS